MMEMKEQTGSRKKYLAPVVVLMLCLVALTGAAYAYTTSVTSGQNGVTADYVSIDLYAVDGTTVVDVPQAETNVNVVTFQTALNKTTHLANITATATDKLVAKAYVKVTEDMANSTTSKLTITPTNPTMSGILQGMTVSVSVSRVLDDATPVDANQDGTYTITNGNKVTIELTAVIGGTTTFSDIKIGNAQGDDYATVAAAAQAYKDAFVTQAKYSISVAAEPITA
jgi:uncharacterized protein YxeA